MGNETDHPRSSKSLSQADLDWVDHAVAAGAGMEEPETSYADHTPLDVGTREVIISNAPETAVVVQRLEITEHGGVAVGLRCHPVDEVWPGQVDLILGDRLARVVE